MSGAPIIVVCGLGRCGTSAVMQMMRAGGVTCLGEWPSFEPAATNPITFDASIFDNPERFAVKILDPFRVPLPPATNDRLRFLWLDRNLEQQARSCVKFAGKLAGLPVTDRDVPRFREVLTGDVEKSMQALRGRHVSRFQFEHLLRRPLDQAQRMSAIVGDPFDEIRAAGAIYIRPTDCAPALDLEYQLLTQGAPT